MKNQFPGRYPEIDMLRGISMMAIILTHATARFLSDPVALFLWNASQFAVAVFIFCSFYLYFKRDHPNPLVHLKKRFVRLLLPYWGFLLFFIPLEISRYPEKLKPSYVLAYFTLLTKGNDLSWLVLLFIMLTVIGVFVDYSSLKSKFWLYGFASLVLVASIAFIFFTPPISFKIIMWLPWSLILLYTFLAARQENNRHFLTFSIIVSAAIFLILFFIQSQITHHSISQYDNKYPPNLFHLSYGILWISLLWGLAKKGVFKIAILTNLIQFLSKHSYSLYFIHFFILYYLIFYWPALILQLGWFGLFILLMASSVSFRYFLFLLPRRH